MRRWLFAVSLSVLVASSACLPLARERNAPSRELAPVLEAYSVLREHYVDKEAVTPEKMNEAAIQGMVAGVNNRFTVYYNPDEFKRATERVRFGDGGFEGIGATMELREGKAVIVSPLPKSPADEAGLKPGDVIVAIDGNPVQGLSLQAVIDRVKGPKDTVVRLSIERARTGERLEFAITRKSIAAISVTYELLAEGLARVRITEFIERTGEDLANVLRVLQEQGVKGIVLDLRYNPGGLVGEVIKVASQFLEDGLVGYEIDNTGKRDEWKVQQGGLATKLPLVVVVNEGSASGSEVLTGALQDQKRATIVGRQTYGKGSVGQQYRLSDGSGLNVIFARWYTPTGRQIDDVGLTPDVKLSEAADADEALQQAIGILKAQVGQKTSRGAAVHAG